jgi:hypothetical protein
MPAPTVGLQPTRPCQDEAQIASVDVRLLRHSFQVIWINAAPHAAEVIYLKAVRDGPTD